MIIGIPKEIKDQEYRVALLPSAVYQLIKRGHQVLVERNAGTGAGYPDEDYASAGATMVSDHAAAYAGADLVMKVKEPLPSEYSLLRPGQILFTYLHLAASRSLTDALLKSRITGLAYETIEVNKRLPLLEPMSTGIDMASQPTLSRFENAAGPRQLYHMGAALAESVIERHAQRLHHRARLVTIDLDPTDDPTHGAQQLSFFNSHYDNACYLPMMGFVTFNDEADQYLCAAALRPGN